MTVAMAAPDAEFLSLADCVRETGRSRETLRVAIASGRLMASRVGKNFLIRRADLEKFMATEKRQRAVSAARR